MVSEIFLSWLLKFILNETSVTVIFLFYLEASVQVAFGWRRIRFTYSFIFHLCLRVISLLLLSANWMFFILSNFVCFRKILFCFLHKILHFTFIFYYFYYYNNLRLFTSLLYTDKLTESLSVIKNFFEFPCLSWSSKTNRPIVDIYSCCLILDSEYIIFLIIPVINLRPSYAQILMSIMSYSTNT